MFPLKTYFIFCWLILGVASASLTIEQRENATWGNSDENTSIQNFTVKWSKKMTKDLKHRIKNHSQFTPPLEEAAFNYGFNTDDMDSWLRYWANDYNFTEREAFLNQFPQYTTIIQRLKIHFIWVKPKVTSDVKVVKLLLLHGWPGSVREFYEAIPLLTAANTSRTFAVEIIAPSLPGFAFSEATSLTGLGATEMAVIFKLLMERLGCDQFYVSGTDWGSFIGSIIATLYPEVVLGYHTTFPVSLSPLTFSTWFAGILGPSLVVDSAVEDRLYPLQSILTWLMTETGYLHIQSTKPDTIGVAMSDSPSGLLAYILQLFSMSSRRENDNKANGGLDMYTRDELIDNLMIYWSTNSFTTSSRIYAETFNIKNMEEGLFATPTTVPTWTVHTKNEMIYQSPKMLQFKFPCLLNSTVYDDFGHFFALEQPELFTDNVFTAIAAFIDWHEEKHVAHVEL